MAKFTQEPETLGKVKTELLVCGIIGFLLFLFIYLLAWLYPVVSSTFNRLVLLHIMHLLVFISTMIIRGSRVQLEWFVIYITCYVISIISDLLGCIWRTILFVNWDGAVVDTVVGYVVIVVSWILLVIDAIQIYISYRLSQEFVTFDILQNTLLSIYAADNGVEGGETLRRAEIKKLAKRLDWNNEPDVGAGMGLEPSSHRRSRRMVQD